MKRRLFLYMSLALAFMALCGTTAYASDISEVPVEEFPFEVAEQAIYYESGWNFGSGRRGVIESSNPYVTVPCYAKVNGYSWLDQNGHILCHDYCEDASIDIPETPENAAKLFLHFKSLNYRNGWTGSDSLKLREVSEDKPQETAPTEVVPEIKSEGVLETQSSQELSDMINDYTGTTVVIVDRSSSMDSFADDATKEFRKLDIDESTIVYVFGRYFKEISAEDITDNSNISVREDEEVFDYLDAVFNDACSKYEPEHIVILTDLGVNSGKLIAQNSLKTVDILVPRWKINPYERFNNLFNFSEIFPNVKLTIREFEE